MKRIDYDFALPEFDYEFMCRWAHSIRAFPVGRYEPVPSFLYKVAKAKNPESGRWAYFYSDGRGSLFIDEGWSDEERKKGVWKTYET